MAAIVANQCIEQECAMFRGTCVQDLDMVPSWRIETSNRNNLVVLCMRRFDFTEMFCGGSRLIQLKVLIVLRSSVGPTVRSTRAIEIDGSTFASIPCMSEEELILLGMQEWKQFDAISREML